MNCNVLLVLHLLLVSLFSEFSWADLEADRKAIEKAHETTGSVRAQFKKELEQALKEKGPQGALGDCKVVAPKLGVKTEIIEVGRTSHKLRNPANQPRDWIKPLLDEYRNNPVKDHKSHRFVRLGPNHYGYVEPIYVEAVCLNCHGGQLLPAVKKEIHALYPQDQATGFKIGDFRGLIWLESRNP